MHHADMDMGHGGHGGHGDMDMGQCNMNVSGDSCNQAHP